MTTLVLKAAKTSRLKRIGEWLARNQATIRRIQWAVVVIYFTLLTVPAFLPLPGSASFIWNDATRLAQFVFWGLWWPFVLLSTALVGRVWCGLLCPEGAITEFASRHGRGRAIPRWMLWGGWPTTAFICTTVYGQMTGVYQYPKPALLILGGSTAAATVVGYVYGKNKRIWCRFLCPVNGVFALLAKLAPLQFRTDPDLWRQSQLRGDRPAAVNCAPLLPLRTMDSSSACHMCGRCSGFRDAITLVRRSPNHEIIHVAGKHPNPWETALIVLGLSGVAVGAFHWSASPWYVVMKQQLAGYLVGHDILWPLETAAPWWIFTNYPEANDVLTLLDGAVLLAYIAATAILSALTIAACLGLAVRSLGSWSAARLHHLAQTLIPPAAAGVFLGLSALTVSQLRMDGIVVPLVDEIRAAILAGAVAWSLYLAWRVTDLYGASFGRRLAAMLAMAGALAVTSTGWVLLFWIW